MDLLRARLGELKRQKNLNFDAIESIRPDFDHTIQLIRSWSMPGPTNFNCVMYALNMRDDQLLYELANSYDVYRATPSHQGETCILADTEFLEFCIAEGSMPPISDRECRPGDLLVYRNKGRCRHIGKVVKPGRVCSKWGPDDLLEHGPREVPDCYGDELWHAKSMTSAQSRDLFIKYARSVVKEDPCVKKHLEHEINTHL